MTTEVLQDTERRLVALTVTLVEKGALPAFYRTPQKQAALEDKLKWHTTRLLQQAGVTLLGQMEQGGISAVGALTPELEIVGQELQGSYLDAYMEGAEGAFERQARSILKRGGVEITWDLVEPRAVEVLKDLSFQASRKLMERITGDVKGVLLKSVGEGLGTREIGNLLKDEIHDLSSKQAEGIARTEVNSASNKGSFMAMEEAQVEYVQWIAAQDTRTRPSHLAHHALVVRRGERFPNGLRHPGDRDGTPIGEWVSCRCAGVAYFPLRSELGQATPFVGRA